MLDEANQTDGLLAPQRAVTRTPKGDATALKAQQALSRLPNAVQQLGVTVTKSQTDFLMIIALYDESDKQTASDIADYLATNLQDATARVDGVGGTNVFGAPYAMRIWLDPNKLAAYGLMPSDITSALQAQNVQLSAGKIGALPSVNAQELNATVTAQAMLQTPEQFRQVVVQHQTDGSVLRLSDIARGELGSESYDSVWCRSRRLYTRC